MESKQLTRKLFAIISIIGYLDYLVNPNKNFVLLLQSHVLVRIISFIAIISIIAIEFFKSITNHQTRKLAVIYTLISMLFLNEIFFNYSFQFSITFIIITIFSLLPILYTDEFLKKLNLKILPLFIFSFVGVGFFILNFIHPKWNDYTFGFYSGMFFDLIAKWAIYLSIFFGIIYVISKFNKEQNGTL